MYYKLLVKKDVISADEVKMSAHEIWRDVIDKHEIETFVEKKQYGHDGWKSFQHSQLGAEYERDASWKAFKKFYRIFIDKNLTASQVKFRASQALEDIIDQHKAEVAAQKRMEEFYQEMSIPVTAEAWSGYDYFAWS